MVQWFAHNNGIVLLIYGMTFIIIATSIFAHSRKDSEYGLAGILWLFAAYAIFHAPADFIDMFEILTGTMSLGLIRTKVIMTYISYLFLFEFGKNLMSLYLKTKNFFIRYLLPLVILGIICCTFIYKEFYNNFDLFIGYFIRFPAGILAGVGMILYYQKLSFTRNAKRMAMYFYSFSAAMIFWAFFCGIIRKSGTVFPANSINREAFFLLTNIPVYVFRSFCGITAAWAIIGILNLFNYEKQERLKLSLERELSIKIFLSKIIANITDPLIVTSTNGIITTVNLALINLLGYKETELLGQNIESFIYHDDWLHQIYPSMQIQNPFEGEVKLLSHKKTFISAVYSCTPIANQINGTVDGFIWIVKVTSIRKRIEAALNSSTLSIENKSSIIHHDNVAKDSFRMEDMKHASADLALLDSYFFLQSIIDSVNDEVIVRNRENTIIMMNRVAKNRMHKYFNDEIFCKSMLKDGVFPCYACSINDIVSIVDKYKKTVYFERYIRDNKVEKIYEVSGSPLCGANNMIIGIVEVGRDITERRALERDLIKVYEIERSHIGQDIHDSLLQNLIGIDVLLKMLFNSLNQHYSSDKNFQEHATHAREIMHFLNNTIDKTRYIAKGLTPITLDKNGFIPSIQQLAQEICSIYNTTYSITTNSDILPIDDESAIHLYYIIQEAITNACKHSGSSSIRVIFNIDNDVLLISVIDNGKGFDNGIITNDGLGIRIMKYRANIIGAWLTIKSTNAGTQITCSIPTLDMAKDRVPYDRKKC